MELSHTPFRLCVPKRSGATSEMLDDSVECPNDGVAPFCTRSMKCAHPHLCVSEGMYKRDVLV